MRRPVVTFFFLLLPLASLAQDTSWGSKVKSAFQRFIDFNKSQKPDCNCDVATAGTAASRVQEDLTFLENLRPISRIHFEKYCQQCHQEWPLNDEERFKTMVRAMGGIMVYELERKLMPKPNSQRPLSDKTRSDMIQYLKNFK